MDTQWLKNKTYIGGGSYKYKCSHDNCTFPRMMHKEIHPEYNYSIYSKYCGYHYILNKINENNTITC